MSITLIYQAMSFVQHQQKTTILHFLIWPHIGQACSFPSYSDKFKQFLFYKMFSEADIQPFVCLSQLEVYLYKHKCAYLALLFILQVFAQRQIFSCHCFIRLWRIQRTGFLPPALFHQTYHHVYVLIQVYCLFSKFRAHWFSTALPSLPSTRLTIRVAEFVGKWDQRLEEVETRKGNRGKVPALDCLSHFRGLRTRLLNRVG